MHEPVKAEDCRPNKALRTTIKVFLKKKGIEREAARKKEMVDQAAATPASQATTQAHETPDGEPSQAPVIPSVGDVEIKYNPAQGSDGVSNQPETVNASDSQNHIRVRPEDAQMDIARPSIEVIVSVYIWRSLLTTFSRPMKKFNTTTPKEPAVE